MNILSINKNIKLIKVLRQDHNFSTRLNYANKKIREIWMNMVNTTYNSTEDITKKLQNLKGKTKLKFYKNISNYYEEMNIIWQNDTFQFEGDPFSKNVESIGKIYHEVLLLMEILQTKPQVENMNINYYDLFYTVIKNRDENEVVNDKYEDNENDYINFNDYITPNHYIVRKNIKDSGREI